MDIQWFPGHMARARRILQEDLKLVDVVIEVVDARIPYSSRNPVLEETVGRRPLLVVMNKADLADPVLTARWEEHFRSRGLAALPVDSVRGAGIAGVTPLVREMAGPKTVSLGSSGRLPRPPRCMIVGIPNVGKSFLINRLAGRKSAKTENRPGVTRGRQWIRVAGEVDLLDTPGILWPKFDDPEVGYRLAVTGAIKDQVYDQEAVAGRLAAWLAANYPGSLEGRYKIRAADAADPQEVLALIGNSRGLVLQGGRVDTYKAAVLLLKEFRAGVLGRYTLESPGS
ncbi:MAG: ribosome biogenesis GTPase YlqF [Peptococcaceae bacterium]|nr:ribosome biogenesis GTPase YlqF [Peptococcaceae bacterium]